MATLMLLLAIFAVYRLATDLAWEDGPGGLYARWRGAALSRYGADDWRSSGVTCPICLSFWLSLPVALALGVYGAVDAWLWPLWWLGIAGAAAFLVRKSS